MAVDKTGPLAGQTLGGYLLISLLGVGGMAEVYRARDAALGRDVAVKVLPQALAADPEYVQRFRDEGRRVAALDQPNIVPVYQFGEESGLLFLVMPLLRESLRDYMLRMGTLQPAPAARIIIEIAQALDAAHALGLVHRDVKPENVLLDPDGKALLTDFGIARPEARLREAGAARTLASTGLPVGTPEYMAPEQLKAMAIDHRVDVYALGAVLYEMVTGTVPYDGATPYEVAASVLTEPLTPPSARNPALWPELDGVIMTALSKDPAIRYADVRGFAAALHRAIIQRDPATAAELTLPDGWAASAPNTLPVPALAASHVGGTVPVLPAASLPAVPAETWRDRLRRPQAASRKTLAAIAAVLVLLIGICGGGSVAILSQFSGPAPGSGLFSSFGLGSATDTTGATPQSTSTSGSGGVNSSNATAGVGAPPPGPGTPSPTASASPTGAPSPTPNSTATSTPAPSRLLLSPSPVPLNKRAHSCTGQQTIRNDNAMAVSWSWTSASPALNGIQYSVDGVPGGSGLPQANTSAGSASTLTFTLSCDGGQSNAVTMRDSLGNIYTFTLAVS